MDLRNGAQEEEAKGLEDLQLWGVTHSGTRAGGLEWHSSVRGYQADGICGGRRAYLAPWMMRHKKDKLSGQCVSTRPMWRGLMEDSLKIPPPLSRMQGEEGFGSLSSRSRCPFASREAGGERG